MARLLIRNDGNIIEFECKKCGIIGNALICEHFEDAEILFVMKKGDKRWLAM